MKAVPPGQIPRPSMHSNGLPLGGLPGGCFTLSGHFPLLFDTDYTDIVARTFGSYLKLAFSRNRRGGLRSLPSLFFKGVMVISVEPVAGMDCSTVL